jgi:hypothetical protein
LGGECVNRQFMKIILKLLGAAILKDFKKSNGHDLLVMTRSFERKKKTFRSSSDELHSKKPPALKYLQFHLLKWKIVKLPMCTGPLWS